MRSLLTIVLGVGAEVCMAQSVVIGSVVDERMQPMPFANVILIDQTDSTFITGTVTKDDGTFAIQSDHDGGLLKVSSVGYVSQYVHPLQGNAGVIRMQPDNQALDEVVVKGSRPQYKMTMGGMTVDIQNSLLKDVGTADDVLSMLPRVQGRDGEFTVFAKGTPEIYIDNKKVQNTSELKQLKSTDIKSVDIITSPGAKYNAEVGAVIRIKTIRPKGDGVSLELYSYLKYNEKWTTYDDATVKYRTGGLEIFGNVMLNHGNHSEDNKLHSEIHANGNHISIGQYAPNSFWYTMPGGQVGASYDFKPDNSVGISYSLNGSIYEGGTSLSQQTIMRNDALEGQVDQLMKTSMSDNPQHEVNIYYVGKVGKLDIDFNSSWVWKKSVRNQTSFEQSQQLSDRMVTTLNENRSNMLAEKLVLSYPIGKGKISVGAEATRSRSHGIYNNLEQVVSPSNDEIKERNVAGFAEYKIKWGDWSFGGGLRYESVISDYYSFGKFQAGTSRKYHDLFPNLTMGWQRGKWGIELNYNKRISRPSYNQLNSNIQYDNRYTYEGGNPLLRPTIKQNIDFDVIYSWFSFTAGYDHSKDMQLNFGQLYQDKTEIIFWSSRNFDKFKSYHVAVTASPRFGFYSPTLTFSYWQQDFDTQAYGIAKSFDKPKFEVDFQNRFSIGKTIKAMLCLHNSTCFDDGFTRRSHRFNIDARIQKTFLDGSFTAYLFANDIFHNLHERWTGYYPITTMSKNAYTYTQFVGVSILYNFNTTKSKYKGTGAGNAEKNRL